MIKIVCDICRENPGVIQVRDRWFGTIAEFCKSCNENRRQECDEFCNQTRKKRRGLLRQDELDRLQLQVPSWINEVYLKYGDANQIRVRERVWAINDVAWMLEVTLTGEDQMDWLRNELQSAPPRSWIDDLTFADRQAVNERYEF